MGGFLTASWPLGIGMAKADACGGRLQSLLIGRCFAAKGKCWTSQTKSD
jgi:hypothetical protein